MEFKLHSCIAVLNVRFNLEISKKRSYICRPHRGVEQYPSTSLRTRHLPQLSSHIENQFL